MWQLEFIAGIIVIVFSFIVGCVCPEKITTGGSNVRWFDPKLFVTELEAGRPWRIGAGLEPSSWTPVDMAKWASQVQLNDRVGFVVENERHRMQWQDAASLERAGQCRQRGADYICSWRDASGPGVRGENAFLMTPYLREWQRRNLWPHVAERSQLFDIGVGTGRSRDLWQARHLRVWGVEPNEKSVAQLRDRHLPQLVAVEPWGGEDVRIREWIPAVDAVMMSYSITFFFHSPERLSQLVENISTALREGGTFVLIGMDGGKVDQWFKTARADTLDNPLFSMKKFYKKRAIFGSEIEVTLKNPNTLVEAQREYLVDFDHFRKVMQHAGFHCKVDRPVDAPAYLGEWSKKWCEAQRFLVFSLDSR